MNSYAGFDLDRIPQLRRALSQVPSAAGAQSRAVGGTADKALAAIAHGKAAAGPQPTHHDHNHPTETQDASLPTDPDRSGYAAPIANAADVAADIGRRLAHLLACQKLQLDGYKIDPKRIFDDEPPPNEQKINNALAQAKKAAAPIWPHGSQIEVDKLLPLLEGMTAAEVEAFVAKLTPEERKALNGALNPVNAGRFANSVYPKVDQQSLQQLADDMPVLQPAFEHAKDLDEVPGLHYVTPAYGLFHPGNTATENDVVQGQLNDCYFLAALAAEQKADPNFAQNHIRPNGNGTYTITFYDHDGKPVPVTVDGKVLTTDPNDDPTRTDDHHPWGFVQPPLNNPVSWVQIYEKAYARWKGSYANTEDGRSDAAMHDLTGRPSSRHDSDDVTFAEINQRLKSGVPVAVSTHGYPLDIHSRKLEFYDHGNLARDHQYVVVGVDEKKRTVTLRNPWGDGDPKHLYVTLNQSDFYMQISKVDYGD